MKKITVREKEILKLILFSRRDIAQKLSLSLSTVKTHLINLFNKIGGNNKTEVLVIALKTGIITLDEIQTENFDD